MGASVWSGIGVLALIAHALSAQPVLVRGEISRAETCLGSAAVTAEPVEPAAGVVLVVLGDTLMEGDMARIQQEISSYYDASARAKEASQIRLGVLTGGSVQFAGPFRTRALLQSALTEITVSPAISTRLHFYSVLGAAAASLGTDWSAVVLIGRFPAVAKELDAFVSASTSAPFRSAKLRVGYWSPAGESSSTMDAVVSTTGGPVLPEGLSALGTALKSDTPFHTVLWTAPSPTSGFRVCPVSLLGADGQPALQVSTIVAASGVRVPDTEQFALFREKAQALKTALASPQLTPEQAAQAEADFSQALEISSRDEELLRQGADLFKRQHNDRKLVAALAILTELAPAEEPLFTDLGHARFRLNDATGAERALLRSRELKPGNGDVAEELTAIRLGAKDDRGALPFLEEAIAARSNKQELWLLRADLATRLDDWQRIADSVEHASALGKVPLERRTAVIRLYLAHQLPERALTHARAVAADLPPDPTLRTEYAGFFDKLQQPDDALAAWKRALESNPKLEMGHVRMTRLLVEKNKLPEALDSANAGIEAAPKAAPLYLDKAEILEKQGRFYDARRILRVAVPELGDPALTLRLAEMEDAGGERAAAYYHQWLESIKDASADDRTRIEKRGLEVAERDGDLKEAAWFRTKLGAAEVATKNAATVLIPGGLDALSFVAHSRQSSPERFLVEYARTVSRYLAVQDKKAAEAYTNNIREHFRRVAEISAFGTAKNGVITVTISAQDKKSQKDAEKVLDLLGWKMHTGNKGVKLEAAEKGARAAHQETASALAIDEVGMQEALESGKPFSFDIIAGTAVVALGEEPWRAQFYPKEKYSGGLAEAIAGDLHLAEIYGAIGQMDPATASALVSAVGLKNLAEKHATRLLEYSSALAMAKGHVEVPGGVPAEPTWASLAGAKPSQPDAFFRAILSKDDGKLLAYFARLGALDVAHQRFFTRTADRTAKFYELFKDSPEIQRASSHFIPFTSFGEVLNELPLNGESVDFPGSPEVWMVAKGRSPGNITKMLKKVKRTAAPDVEDEILLRLARTRYGDVTGEHTELDNFLAVVRVDSHRSDPLDEASALLLAQHFVQDGEAYPFFAALTGLGQKEFEQFFAATESIRGRSDSDRMPVLAPLNSIIEILALAQQSGGLTEEQATALFGRTMTALQKGDSAAVRVAASLDLVRDILATAAKSGSANPDEAMRTLLLGAAPPVDLELEAGAVTVDPSKSRHAAFQQVLELQKVPSLTTMLGVADAARSLGAGKDAPALQIQKLQTLGAAIPYVDVPKELKLAGKDREMVEGFQPRHLQEIVKKFEEKTAKKKVDPKELEKLSQEYLDEIDAPVRWALEGIVYAYFLSPDDLLVSEDSLLLRKHHLVVSAGSHKSPVWQPSDLSQSSEKAGSYFTGGFANFGDAAGLAAALSAKLGGDTGQLVASKQMAGIREANWGSLRDDDLRLLGLKVTVAREWMVRASDDPALQSTLAETTLGLLSLNRRADLLRSIADRNWTSVWNLATLSDLYFLGDRYLTRYSADPWQSPTTVALRQVASRDDGLRLQILGGDETKMFGCSHTHLQSAPPYEEYEKELLGARLAERSAEFKLYLAKSADAAGITPRALGAVAEPAARVMLKRLSLSDIHDWRSALEAYSKLNAKTLEGMLAK